MDCFNTNLTVFFNIKFSESLKTIFAIYKNEEKSPLQKIIQSILNKMNSEEYLNNIKHFFA